MTGPTKLRSLVTLPDPGAEVEVRRRLDQLTKPPGSLGRLEELVVRLATIAGTCPPPLRDPVIFTLAGDHGVVAQGVRAYPQIVTAPMVENFLRGGAAVNVLARRASAPVVVADLRGATGEGVTGPGTGVDAAGRRRKVEAIRRALERNAPDPADPLDTLAKVGGFEIAGLVGVILAGAAYRLPVVLDGFIAGAAALVAVRLEPAARRALLAAHRSAQPRHPLVLDALRLEPYLHLRMPLREGTGA